MPPQVTRVQIHQSSIHEPPTKCSRYIPLNVGDQKMYAIGFGRLRKCDQISIGSWEEVDKNK